jgi:hypothetical protein
MDWTTDNLILKKTLSKVDCFSRIAQFFFGTALMAQSAQKQQKYKIHLSFYSTWEV